MNQHLNPLQAFQWELKQEASKNLAKTLQTLGQIFEQNKAALNEVIGLQGRYERLKRDKRSNLIAFEQAEMLENQILHSVLEIIDNINEQAYTDYQWKNAVFERILVISKSRERNETMKGLLSPRYYREIEFITPEDAPPIATINRFELIVFDDMETDENYFSIYNKLLQHTIPYILYFGTQRVAETYDGKPKAYFANSVFALNPRLQELLMFIKYTH